jgi:hypothetical protein
MEQGKTAVTTNKDNSKNHATKLQKITTNNPPQKKAIEAEVR